MRYSSTQKPYSSTRVPAVSNERRAPPPTSRGAHHEPALGKHAMRNSSSVLAIPKFTSVSERGMSDLGGVRAHSDRILHLACSDPITQWCVHCPHELIKIPIALRVLPCAARLSPPCLACMQWRAGASTVFCAPSRLPAHWYDRLEAAKLHITQQVPTQDGPRDGGPGVRTFGGHLRPCAVGCAR